MHRSAIDRKRKLIGNGTTTRDVASRSISNTRMIQCCGLDRSKHHDQGEHAVNAFAGLSSTPIASSCPGFMYTSNGLHPVISNRLWIMNGFAHGAGYEPVTTVDNGPAESWATLIRG